MPLVQGPNSSAEEEISRLMIRYEKDLLRLCILYLRDTGMAEDAVQETFLKAWRHLGAFRRESSEKTWLTRIAVNVCKDMRRTKWEKNARRTVSLDGFPLPQQPPSPEAVALTEEVLRLPKKQLDAILLCAYQGFSVTEAAKILGVTPSAVSARIKKALSLLRKALEGSDDP